MPRTVSIAAALVFAVAVISLPAMGEDATRSTDKRLSRSMELYQLETGRSGLADDTGKGLDPDMRRENERAVREGLADIRRELARQARKAEPDDEAAAGGNRVYRIRKGNLASALEEVLREPTSAIDGNYRLVWRAPHYLVPEDYDIAAHDALEAVEKVLDAYNREGVSLEALLFRGNNVIEVSLGGFRQKVQAGKTAAREDR